MDDSRSLFPQEQPPPIDPAFFQKIDAEMKELAEKIPVVAKQPSTEKIWCKIGSLWYGHPVTPLILRYKALMWLKENPPDPRGEKFAKRDGPYYVYVFVKEFAQAINKSERTVERLLAEARIAAVKGPREKITVEYLCYLNNFNEDEIQQNLHDIFMGRWNKHKKKRKRDDDDD